MSNKFLAIHFAYQPSRNMKYLGPKGSINIKKSCCSSKPLIMCSIDSMNKYITNSELTHKVVVGFESEKVLKSIDDPNIGYSLILDYKNINHGKILKDILLKYNIDNYDGCFITSDISFILRSNLDIDTNNNYIFYSNNVSMDTENTCNLDNNKVEYLMYNTSDNYWTGMCFFSNELIRLIKHINLVYFTDPLFLMEIINKTINSGAKFEGYKLTNKDFSYISNTTLKKMKAV